MNQPVVMNMVLILHLINIYTGVTRISHYLAFDVIRTLGMSNQIIFYNLQIIWLLLSIDLDT